MIYEILPCSQMLNIYTWHCPEISLGDTVLCRIKHTYDNLDQHLSSNLDTVVRGPLRWFRKFGYDTYEIFSNFQYEVPCMPMVHLMKLCTMLLQVLVHCTTFLNCSWIVILFELGSFGSKVVMDPVCVFMGSHEMILLHVIVGATAPLMLYTSCPHWMMT